VREGGKGNGGEGKRKGRDFAGPIKLRLLRPCIPPHTAVTLKYHPDGLIAAGAGYCTQRRCEA